RWRYALAGGATMDAGCYPIQLVRFLAGAEPEVTGAHARLLFPQVDRFMRADLRFADGRNGRIVCSMLSPVLISARLVVRGDAGALRVFNPYLPHVFHRLQVRTRHGTRPDRARGEPTYVHQL